MIKNNYVRARIAKHPNLKYRHVIQLVNDADEDVRKDVVNHPIYQKMKKEGKI